MQAGDNPASPLTCTRAKPTGTSQRYAPAHFHPGQIRSAYRKHNQAAMRAASMRELITLGVQCQAQSGRPASWRALDVRLDRWS